MAPAEHIKMCWTLFSIFSPRPTISSEKLRGSWFTLSFHSLLFATCTLRVGWYIYLIHNAKLGVCVGVCAESICVCVCFLSLWPCTACSRVRSGHPRAEHTLHVHGAHRGEAHRSHSLPHVPGRLPQGSDLFLPVHWDPRPTCSPWVPRLWFVLWWTSVSTLDNASYIFLFRL